MLYWGRRIILYLTSFWILQIPACTDILHQKKKMRGKIQKTRSDCLGICDLKIKLNSNKFPFVAFYKEGVGMDAQIILFLSTLQFDFKLHLSLWNGGYFHSTLNSINIFKAFLIHCISRYREGPTVKCFKSLMASAWDWQNFYIKVI